MTRAAAPPISVRVFTLNEERNIAACLAGLHWSDDVVVVDSYSSDATRSICQQYGVGFLQHEFSGFGDQRNWALENSDPRHDWVLILDADERVSPELLRELVDAVQTASTDVAAFRMKRRFYMWGRWLRYSSLYPSWIVRVVRVGRVKFVNRGHAETQYVDGVVESLASDLIDENLKGIDDWFERQNRYSRAEAEYELALARTSIEWKSLFAADPLARRRTLKQLSILLPARPMMYFLYSYFCRGGFLDGRDGLTFCVMRSIYEGMIVAKKHDLRRQGR